jgi:hypothetical protein
MGEKNCAILTQRGLPCRNPRRYRLDNESAEYVVCKPHAKVIDATRGRERHAQVTPAEDMSVTFTRTEGGRGRRPIILRRDEMRADGKLGRQCVSLHRTPDLPHVRPT